MRLIPTGPLWREVLARSLGCHFSETRPHRVVEVNRLALATPVGVSNSQSNPARQEDSKTT